MKSIEFEHPNKMRFESGFKTFDNQTNLISTGNLVSNTQYSTCVRSRNTVKCGDKIFPKGDLQQFDLDHFETLPQDVRKFFEQGYTISNNVWLYQFRHFSRGKKIVDGFVITDYSFAKILKVWYRNWFKSYYAVQEAMKYIADDPHPQEESFSIE